MGLFVSVLIYFNHLVNQISSQFSYQIEKLIFLVILKDIERNVLETRGIFTERNKFRNLVSFELTDESFVFGPEKSYIRNVVQKHGHSFNSHSTCPTHSTFIRLQIKSLNDILMNNTTPKNLKPFLLIPNLKLKRWFCKWKVIWKPLELKRRLAK